MNQPTGDLVARPTRSALAVTDAQTEWTQTQKAALQQLGIERAPDGDLAVFLNYAQKTGLDPFARQIYMIGRNTKDRQGNWTTKWTIQASIDGLRIVAERSGEYAGQTEPEFCGEDGVWRNVWTSAEPPVAARIGVMRHGFAQPLYGIAYYADYVQLGKDGKVTGLWSKPRIMLAKCAEALALRKAFPNDLAGIYTADEMGQAEHPEPPVTRVDTPNDEPMMSKQQTATLITLFDSCGLTDKDSRQAFITETMGRHVAAAFMTAAECEQVITALTAILATPSDAEIVDGEVVEDEATP